MKKTPYYMFLFAKDHRKMTSGWQRDSAFQQIRPGARFKTGDFVKKKLGGGSTVVRRTTFMTSSSCVRPKNWHFETLLVMCYKA